MLNASKGTSGNVSNERSSAGRSFNRQKKQQIKRKRDKIGGRPAGQDREVTERNTCGCVYRVRGICLSPVS